MHRGGIGARLAVLLSAAGVGGCMSFNATKHTYAANASSPVVRVNGADVRLQLKPEGTDGPSFVVSAMIYSAAAATLDGPFRWRLEATGAAGSHESMIVHRLRTRTAVTKRDEWYPSNNLNKQVDFRKRSGSEEPWRAVYDIPGLLKVKPREDGALEILADISVRAAGKSERRVVKFRLDPAKTRQDEFIFLPAEIVESIGKPMSEWEDPGWD